MIDRAQFDTWKNKYGSTIIEELCTYINIDTSNNQEERAYGFLRDILAKDGFECTVENYHPDIINSAYATNPVRMQSSNLRASLSSGQEDAPIVLFNSHIDVVPQSPTAESQFAAIEKDGVIFGRGACDTKGNLFLLLGALRFLSAYAVRPSYDIALDLVSGEETGGNGTLSTLLHGRNADLVVVFEPTELKVFHGHRGCLTTELTVLGKSVHMGSDETGASAIKSAAQIVLGLQNLEAEMLTEASRDPAFSVWDRPVQINVGKIAGGEWPGSVPEICKITFNTGFLPPTAVPEMESRICEYIDGLVTGEANIALRYDFTKGLRNEAYMTVPENPHAMRMTQAASSDGEEAANVPLGWCVSCDARHYAKIAGLPTVIFGAGSLSDAHTANEKLAIDDLFEGMFILAKFLS